MSSDAYLTPRHSGQSAGQRARSIVSVTAHVAAAAAAAVYSFEFGAHIGGPGLGALAAINGAVISALMVGALLDRIWPT